MNQKKQDVAVHPKYRIAELLRDRYGELKVHVGYLDLAEWCNLKNIRTVQDWAKIPAGTLKTINHLLLPSVLRFFQLTKERQLLTKQHISLTRKEAA